MTLIATFSIDGTQFLIGDSLISSQPKHPVSIPSALNEGNGFLTELAYVSDVCQKVFQISSDCVIAFAGMKIAAKMVIEDFLELQAKNQLTFETVSRCFNGYIESGDARHFSVVGWLQEDGIIKNINLDVREYESSVFGTVSMAGTGVASFLDLLNHHEKISATPGGFDPNLGVRYSGPYADDPMYTALALTGDLLHVEANDMSTVSNSFGGSYQVVYFDGVEFRHIDAVSYTHLTLPTICSV